MTKNAITTLTNDDDGGNNKNEKLCRLKTNKLHLFATITKHLQITRTARNIERRTRIRGRIRKENLMAFMSHF